MSLRDAIYPFGMRYVPAGRDISLRDTICPFGTRYIPSGYDMSLRDAKNGKTVKHSHPQPIEHPIRSEEN